MPISPFPLHHLVSPVGDVGTRMEGSVGHHWWLLLETGAGNDGNAGQQHLPAPAGDGGLVERDGRTQFSYSY